MIQDDVALLPSARHIAALDGVRGIAILIVMLHHFEILLPGGTLGKDILKGIFYTGWSGVDLFFVLSGFLITGILIDAKGAVNYFTSFYARRALRIFPLYYVVLGVIVAFANAFFQPGFDNIMALRSDKPYYFVYLNNWWLLLHDTWHANIIGHFWSLAVEEQFYLIWPICIWIAPPRHVLKVAVSGCVLAFVLRLSLVAVYGPSHAIDQNTFTRMDALLAGACCAVIVRDQHLLTRAQRWLNPLIILAAAAMVWVDLGAGELWSGGKMTETVGFTVLAIGYSAFLLKVYLAADRRSRMRHVLELGWLRRVGKYSYGMYILHVPILMFGFSLMKTYFGAEAPLPIGIAVLLTLFLVTFIAAAISYENFEKYLLRFRPEPRFRIQPVGPASPLEVARPEHARS